MRKLVKNQKGFTLIELMMVIAVIGILAAVLIPKMGGIKDSAKEAGTEANFRMVVAQANAIISKYSAGEIKEFEEALAKRLEKNEGEITNPISNESSVKLNSVTTPPGVIYKDADNTVKPFDSWSKSSSNLKGAVAFAAFEENGVLKCKVWYYDSEGNKVPSKDDDVETVE